MTYVIKFDFIKLILIIRSIIDVSMWLYLTEINFNIYHVIICCLVSSYITGIVYNYYLTLLKRYSDGHIRLVKQLVVGAGDLYHAKILPEYGLIMIRSAEAIMTPALVRKYATFDYTKLYRELESRTRSQFEEIQDGHYQAPKMTEIKKIDRSKILLVG